MEDLGEESNIEESVEDEEVMVKGHRGKRGPPPTVEVDVQEFKRLCTLSGNDSWTVAQLAQHFECSIARVKNLKRSLGLTQPHSRQQVPQHVTFGWLQTRWTSDHHDEPLHVPEGRVYSRRLVFVSVRTINRHHHHLRSAHVAIARHKLAM